MGISTMVRFTGKVAVFAAMAALLLHASCTISLSQLGIAEAIPMDDAGCHHSLPVQPDAPNSGQMCCNGQHSLEALLTTVPIAPAPLATTELVHGLLDTSLRSTHAAEIAIPSSDPPGPLVLRI
jgi:hypothetical protein